MTSPQSLKDRLQWFVLRIKWRHESDVNDHLVSEGIPTFLPWHYVIKRRANGHKERVLQNVIPELLFVYASYNYLDAFMRKMKHLYNYDIYFEKYISDSRRHILVVPDCQMRNFINVASRYTEDILYVKPEEVQLNKGVRVRVHGGPFDGLEGELLRLKGKRSKRVVVRIDQLAVVAASVIEPDLLEILS